MEKQGKEFSRRRFISHASKIGGASAVLGVSGAMGLFMDGSGEYVEAKKPDKEKPQKSPKKGDTFMLLNVRLESGYEYENGYIVATRSVIRNLEITKGTISKILDLKESYRKDLDCYDAKGLLLLPGFKDMHIHLDKTFYGGPWRGAVRRKNIFDIIEAEKTLLLELLPTAQERAEKLIELIAGFGSTYVRSHCNVDPTVGLRNLEELQKALANYSDKISHEIVAFPQHGLLLSESESLMREAMKLGATHVGGLDPTLVDGNMEKSLQTMVQIAVDSNAGIDIHLHEGGETGIKSVNRLADLTEEAGLQGKVTISHAFSLASLSESQAHEMASRLASLGISIASTIPIGKNTMPIPILQQRNVNVMLGNDSIMDPWSSLGIGDTLEKVHLAAGLYGWSYEEQLSQALSLATGGITPLNKEGKQVWPKVGDEASVVLVPASCSAEAVARLPKRAAVLHKGVLSSGELSYKKK
ncbi:deaminase [Priestia aryabhattai]|uniref:amidohydrolase family protein n=1 Tax=Bacillaceae TaxID=186817 RepID=UPI000BA022EC|nr:amidohydrolase family protein [Bacillus sp. CBEL-1]OZT12445.1 deaminase [Priestia aryabhattai]TDB55291.1 deaminase [Bacillus sp. CBEL-1]